MGVAEWGLEKGINDADGDFCHYCTEAISKRNQKHLKNVAELW